MMPNRKVVGKGARPTCEVTPIGLGTAHREELTEFFGGPGRPGETREVFEAAVGLRSTFNDAAERLAASRAANEEAARRRRQVEGRRRRLARQAERGGLNDRDLLDMLGLQLDDVTRPILTHDDMVTARPSKSSPGGGPGVADERLLALAWHGASRRMRVVRNALARMATADVVVLYRVLGPRNGYQEALLYGAKSLLGELAPLAPLTDAAEDARAELALLHGLALEDGATTHVEQLGAVRQDELETAFWEAATEEVDARARAYVYRGRARLLREEAARELREIDFAKHRALEDKADHAERVAAAWRAAQESALGAFRREVTTAPARRLDASYAACRAGDVGTTAEDAVRLLLRPAPATATPAEREAHERRRDDFMRAVNIDVSRLWAEASRAYLAARGGTP